MFKLFCSICYVLTRNIVISILLMTVPLAVGAQERKSDLDREALEGKLASCIYRQDCYELDDIEKETVSFQLIGVKCPESESEFGQVFMPLYESWAMTESIRFEIHGLEMYWRFGDVESEDDGVLLIVRNDGTALTYKSPIREEGTSVELTEVYPSTDELSCVISSFLYSFFNNNSLHLFRI